MNLFNFEIFTWVTTVSMNVMKYSWLRSLGTSFIAPKTVQVKKMENNWRERPLVFEVFFEQIVIAQQVFNGDCSFTFFYLHTHMYMERSACWNFPASFWWKIWTCKFLDFGCIFQFNNHSSLIERMDVPHFN